MFIPYKVDVPMQRWPIANFILIGLTVIISFGLFFPLDDWTREHRAARNLDPEFQKMLEAEGIQVSDEPPPSVIDSFMLEPAHFRVTQLIGHMFLHADFWHLAGNMLFLFVFGNAVNAKLGHVQFLAIYFLTGIVTGLVWLLAGPGNPCLGASGAIMGIVGAFLLLYPTNDVSVGYMFTIFYRGTFEISAMWVIALYVAFDVWGLVGRSNSGVAYLSHVIGFSTGALSAAALLWFKVTEMDSNEKSLLQVWGWMPHADDGKKGAAAVFAAHVPAAPMPVRRPPAPRKPVDTGPIPLD